MDRQETEYDITLSSLAGGGVYSTSNAISNFTNPLSKQVTLNGEWEVAVKKVSYHNNIINVHEGQNKIEYKGYKYNRSNDGTILRKFIYYDDIILTTHYIFELPAPGSYMNPSVFIHTLHNLNYYDTGKAEVIKLGELVNFEYLEATQTLQIKDVSRHDEFERENEVKELTLSPNLASMTGLVWDETNYSCKFKLFNEFANYDPKIELMFKGKYPQIIKEPWTAYMYKFPYTVLWAANYKLYVNIDISSPPAIGNERVNALLSVPVTQEPNVYTSYEPVHLTYKNVTKHTFNTISCLVTDSDGNKIKFLNGSGAFTLQIHLRRVR